MCYLHTFREQKCKHWIKQAQNSHFTLLTYSESKVFFNTVNSLFCKTFFFSLKFFSSSLLLCLSLSRFSYCMSSSSVGALHGLASRGMVSCARPPASQTPLPEVPHPLQCAAVLALPYQTPAPAAPLLILAPPQRFVFLTRLHM